MGAAIIVGEEADGGDGTPEVGVRMLVDKFEKRLKRSRRGVSQVEVVI